MTDPKSLVNIVGINAGDLMPRTGPDRAGNVLTLSWTGYNCALLAEYLRGPNPLPEALREYEQMVSSSSDHPFMLVLRWRQKNRPKLTADTARAAQLVATGNFADRSERLELADMIDPSSSHPYRLKVQKRGRGRRPKLFLFLADKKKQIAVLHARRAEKKEAGIQELITGKIIRNRVEFFNIQRCLLSISHFFYRGVVDSAPSILRLHKQLSSSGKDPGFAPMNQTLRFIEEQVSEDGSRSPPAES